LKKVALFFMAACAVLCGPSQAALAAYACDSANGTGLCCSNEVWLNWQNIAISVWQGPGGSHAFWAKRRDINFNITYNHYVGDGGTWTFDNGSDAFRATGIHRDGSSIAWLMQQASDSHPNC
jgi:hypothetical protein